MSDCNTCVHNNEPWDSEACDGCCGANSHYEPKKGATETVWDLINWWDSMKEDIHDEA